MLKINRGGTKVDGGSRNLRPQYNRNGAIVFACWCNGGHIEIGGHDGS